MGAVWRYDQQQLRNDLTTAVARIQAHTKSLTDMCTALDKMEIFWASIPEEDRGLVQELQQTILADHLKKRDSGTVELTEGSIERAEQFFAMYFASRHTKSADKTE
jgi:hypothetical protein